MESKVIARTCVEVAMVLVIVREVKSRCFPSQVMCCVGVRWDFGDSRRCFEER